MINEETASVFDRINKYFRLPHWHGRATKAAPHEFAPSFVIIPDVLRSMQNDFSSLSLVIKAGFKTSQCQ